MQKKRITVSVPVYNEEKNVRPAYARIKSVMEGLEKYDYEIVFFDDGSTDGSRKEIEEICAEDPRAKAVFYTRNFGYSKNVFYCMQQAQGDAAVLIHCDLQNPPEEIPRLVERWEQGADAVLGVKNKSRENRFVFLLRTLCYRIANVFFGMRLIPHATEFELLDRSLVNVLREIRSPRPFLRGYVLEYASHVEKVFYLQEKRAQGKSHFNLAKYYDFAVCGMVHASRCLPRRFLLVSLVGMLLAALELFIGFVPRAVRAQGAFLWDGLVLRFGVFALLFLLLIVSLLFEYVIALSENMDRKPEIVEEKRLNF